MGSGPTSGSVPPTTQAENPFMVPECPPRAPPQRRLEAGGSAAPPHPSTSLSFLPSPWPWADHTQVVPGHLWASSPPPQPCSSAGGAGSCRPRRARPLSPLALPLGLAPCAG